VDYARLASIKNYLLDMDGTVYLGANPIDGAPEFMAYLKETGRGRLFFTNNSSANACQYSDKLCAMGMEAAKRDVLTSGEATARYLVSETAFRRVFVLGTPSFEAELMQAGIALDSENPEVVVLAFDKTLTYAKLVRAAECLLDGLPYIATHPDKVCPTETGYIPDCGAMAALLKESTGRDPKYIGKPNPEMVRMGLAKLDAQADTTAMVGDRLYTDMQMAYNAGTASILVLSGETKQQDLEQADRQPDFVFDSVRQLHEALVHADAETGGEA
jgi:HAD superfamily hydrolase (TIGR01450 family)